MLPGRPEGALWSSGAAASAAESSAGHVGLASPYSPFLGKFPPPARGEDGEGQAGGRRGAWGGGGTRGGKSMRVHGTKAIRRAGGEPAEGIGWEMRAGAEPGFH